MADLNLPSYLKGENDKGELPAITIEPGKVESRGTRYEGRQAFVLGSL